MHVSFMARDASHARSAGSACGGCDSVRCASIDMGRQGSMSGPTRSGSDSSRCVGDSHGFPIIAREAQPTPLRILRSTRVRRALAKCGAPQRRVGAGRSGALPNLEVSFPHSVRDEHFLPDRWRRIHRRADRHKWGSLNRRRWDMSRMASPHAREATSRTRAIHLRRDTMDWLARRDR